MPLPRSARLAAIGTAALLTAIMGLTVGFAKRDQGVADPAGEDTGWTGARAPAPTVAVGRPLRVLAEPRELTVGTAVNVHALAGEQYRSVLGREFSAITVEDAMKWAALEPVQGEYQRTEADQLIAFAEEQDQRVYGHTLVWHRQVPDWVSEGSFSDQETERLLRTHVQEQVSYFRERVWAWDVVNEPLEADGTLRDSLWLRRLGPDYLADAFRWARAADPDARLFINDFGIEGINDKSNALYHLVAQLVAEGVPIDGVGFQVHWDLSALPGSFAENLNRFASLGLDVAITELDARMPEPVTEQKLQRQAGVYAEAIDACLAIARCVSFTVWGFTDAHSWVPKAYPGSGAATMFDEQYAPKPAYGAVAEALRLP